ncbi:hypothetical protein P1P75_01270 [Streptomyces sp. ID05-39B]|uniref:hypothetical protein n=1 Tax=Streptomyces sp. ID05-39B TaxID=3028664 RepID=UPI0029B1C665|nr:hypothetical protein [Streptomyces sp. ID05-39B]MDX3525111.1 hypothetical protein [Streptomyces sp. ID05-39B]
MAARREETAVHEIGPEFGEKLGLAQGDTVEVVTDHWDEVVASKGERGEVTHFVNDGVTTFTYVLINGSHFPFEPDEIKKVEAGE